MLLNLKPVNSTLFIIITEDDKKVACVSLGIRKDSEKIFSSESLDLALMLRNIPLSFYSLLKKYEQKQEVYTDMISSIVKILSLHNPYTNEHSENVAILSVKIAEKLNLSSNEIDRVYWSALVHDIGKIIVPEAILDKVGKLTAEEYEVIKMHPVWGYETLVSNPSLSNIATNVLYHHERWDGKGYPEGLKENEIPLISRIISVADSYDAMITDRPYRKALPKAEVIKEIIHNSSTQFDPIVVNAFLQIKELP